MEERPGLFQLLKETDVISQMRDLFDSGMIYFNLNGKISIHTKAINIFTPWIKIGQESGRICYYWRDILEMRLNLLPDFCRNKCYKVVARPRSFHEVMILYELMYELGLPSKIGMELRDYVPADWGAYFYANSLEEGKTIYELTKEAISSKSELKDIRVYLKRSCTEFEIKYGPTDQWKEMDEEEKEKEKWIRSLFDEMPQMEIDQPTILKNHIIAKMMQYAWGLGDKTVMMYNAEQPLIQSTVTYQG